MNQILSENRNEPETAEETLCRFSVSGEENGKRLDQVLAALMEESSRSYLVKQIENGRVSLNGEPCLVKKQMVRTGDEITLDFEPPKELAAEPENIPLDIVYEDDSLIVLDKPAGLVVHPAPGTPSGTLVNGLLYHCRGRLSSINGVVRPGIVHRIDKDTSGLLVVAKTDLAHQSLSAQLSVHSMTRAYKALATGVFKEDAGTVNRPVGRDPVNRLKNACLGPMRKEEHLVSGYPLQQGAREAVTHWKVLKRYSKFTLLECRLETGRTHQIRVHLASVGHPLAGDPLYGHKDTSGFTTQALHAYLLGFRHPLTDEYMEFHSDLPADFQAKLAKLL